MFWRVFKRSSARATRDDGWWHEAERAADSPDPDAIAGLRASMNQDASLDEAEQQEEMMDGLEQLVPLATAAALPAITTQHRVIGSDTCHLALPATLSAEQSVPGKLFLTDRRLVFAGGRAQAWPWHRVRVVTRTDRIVSIVVTGPSDAIQLQCNTYGDAVCVRFMIGRLTNRSSGSDPAQ